MLPNLKPMPGRIIVKRNIKEQPSSSILLTEAVLEEQDSGIIVAIGHKDDIKHLNVGMTVLFGSYARGKFKLDGIEYLSMKKPDIFAYEETL